jgi:hypothetical protein
MTAHNAKKPTVGIFFVVTVGRFVKGRYENSNHICEMKLRTGLDLCAIFGVFQDYSVPQGHIVDYVSLLNCLSKPQADYCHGYTDHRIGRAVSPPTTRLV